MSSQNHLAALPLELHTHIFSNLQPYDILQVRQTCQALYRASSQRTVWTDALHRICVENTLFEPSFPVASMSVLGLQRASMGPHRWIARTSSKERNHDGVLSHSVTRHPMSAIHDVFPNPYSWHVHYLVPGGRYLFVLCSKWLVFWDLGSHSSGREPHIVAAVPVKYNAYYLVHSTPDGMGLRVFLLHNGNQNEASFYIYEIFPESASPRLTRIAYTRIPSSHTDNFFALSYDRLIFIHGNILTVWDYKANMWARWGVEGEYSQIITTKSAVMLIHTCGVSVWKIPPLLPESSLSMSTNPSVVSPVFEIDYPKNHLYHGYYQAPCGWYSGTPQSFYYDMAEDIELDADSHRRVGRFEVTINSEISGGTLNLLKTFEVPLIEGNEFVMPTRICQDKNVSLWIDINTGHLGTHVSDIYDQQLPSFSTPLLSNHSMHIFKLTFCPVTCRVVYCETDKDSPAPSIIVCDF